LKRLRKLKLDRPAAVFFAITIVSVVLLAFPLWNYTRFYLAMWNFDYKVLSITVDMEDYPTKVRVNVELLVMNPTDYSGFEVSTIECGLDYIDGNHQVLVVTGPRSTDWITTNLWDLKIGSYPAINRQLAPNANETILLSFFIDPNSGTSVEQNNARYFMEFLRNPPAEIGWSLTCRLVLSSFMGGFDVRRDFSYSTPTS
jgi:hypothetical protein